MKNMQQFIQYVKRLNKDYVFAVGVFSSVSIFLCTVFGNTIGFSASSFYGTWVLHLMGVLFITGVAYKMISFMMNRMTEDSNQEESLSLKSFSKSFVSMILLVSMTYVVILNSLLLGTFLNGLYVPVFLMTIGVPLLLSLVVTILEIAERKMSLRV